VNVVTTLRKLEGRLDGHEVLNRVPQALTVDADRELLGLALRQLLDNALKYSSPTSTIDIHAQGNGAVQIAVHNSNSAIPEQDQARIFERFYRGAQARHIPGTGIGLAIVQQIAAAHGGTLTVSSSSDAGTTFALSLPRGGPRS
jgi:two-component system sensor histidine kinase KdpD